MNIAVTDRTGPDDSPLTLHVDRSNEIDSAILGTPVEPRYPALGALVCAKGQGGWAYIGAVTSIDAKAGTYTILPISIKSPGASLNWPPSREK